MGKIAGVNTASLGVYFHSTKTRARWAEGFHELNGHVFNLERDGLHQVVLAQDSPCDDNTQPYHTGSVAARVNKNRAFRRTSGRRCQVRYWCTIEDSRKRQHHHRHLEHKDSKSCREIQELTHEMDRYRWNILGLCEMRWKNFGETTTVEGHQVFFSGKENKHEHGVGFLVHKDIVNTVMGSRPVSSRLISIHLRTVPFNITVVQAYTPTSDYDDNEIEEIYDQLHKAIDQTPKKDILVV